MPRNPDLTGADAVERITSVRTDVALLGKGFGNGFPVACVAVREPFMESIGEVQRELCG